MCEPYVYINGIASWIVNNFQPRTFKNSVAFNIQVFSWDYKETPTLILPTSYMYHDFKAPSV